MYRKLLSLVAFIAALSTGVAAEDEEKPGELVPPVRLADGSTQLVITPRNSDKYEREDDDSGGKDEPPELVGLLFPKQYYCVDPGYGICPNKKKCCPIGGRCCTTGCCGKNKWCYSSFCCTLQQNGCDNRGCCPKGYQCCKGGDCCKPGNDCVIVNGQLGCCPKGETCTSRSCVDPGYVPCKNYNFCCLPGRTCFVDSAGNRLCRAPAPDPDPTYTFPTYTATRTTTNSPNDPLPTLPDPPNTDTITDISGGPSTSALGPLPSAGNSSSSSSSSSSNTFSFAVPTFGSSNAAFMNARVSMESLFVLIVVSIAYTL